MSLGRRSFLAAAVLTAAFDVARAAEPLKRPKTVAELWVRTELYFGTSRAAVGPVTELEFNDFIEREVTPRFPDGLTLLTGYGQFKNSNGELVRERSYLVILFYPRQTQDANKYIQEVRDIYKRWFDQESVLRVDSVSLVSF
jgi:hypothetical protein